MLKESPKVILLTLGEELLLGLTPNSHLTYVGNELRKRGVTLHSNLTISDEATAIKEEFEACWKKADILITTGGLGPTVDDRTKEIICQSLDESLVFDKSIQIEMEKRFERLGLKMTENNLKQAYRPENSEVLENPNGTAPGILLEKAGKTLIMLPGPPRELVPMFESSVLPYLAKTGVTQEAENYIQIKTIGIGESALETKLQSAFAEDPSLQIAYCAHPGQVDIRLSYDHSPGNSEALSTAAEKCRELLGSDFLCFGEGSLAEVVSTLLRQKQTTLALAESCTGGLIAHAITNLTGASDFFRGGIACYQDDVKIDMLNVPEGMIQQHTAVSQEVAVALATGVSEKFEAEYTLSTTGYAGPTGGDGNNPVGTVFIGLHTAHGIWCKKVHFQGSRETVKRRTMNVALDWLRRVLMEEPKGDAANEALREESKNILKSLS
ncbi:UNVERIFIED_CONTAM: hypothetical protein GTU68_006430 [Idotea baltica]|nr:hypothetical protein [Idotea baltica]